ncbi:unnamed protein product [Rotaria sordida]|uniref:Uncharacterized protein n=1 Tax=Rotaria sordida TaxID=392033 RepID=A0A816EQ69_9BILA|nr:unnamed protein product [Rotaria sordida]CAF1651066.1 unnamed protein product [Rotaria sordida]
MLSENEYRKTKQQLENIPRDLPTKQQNNLKKLLKKKLHEHELASKYPPFQPLPYAQFFINYATHELTLLHLIESVQCSKKIILDTESITIPHQPNEPALIQLQLILPTSYSYVIFVEVCHLPREHDTTFDLIKLFFHTLFQFDKIIYIWGEIKELTKFIKFGLFSNEQIRLSNNINCQDEFKKYWQRNYPHKISSYGSTEDSQCNCESCLGINPQDPWSLQNAVAHKLHLYLDKRFTISQFDIGLDSQLKHLNDSEIKHRERMIHYAANDCLSIYQLILELNFFHHEQSVTSLSSHKSNKNISNYSFQLLPISSNDDLIVPNEYDIPSTSRTVYLIETPTVILDNHSSTPSQFPTTTNTSTKPKYKKELSAEERKKLHNKTCTLKQRKRYFRFQITREDIDKRFTTKQIKKILKQHNIPVTAVSFSSRTNKKALIIGLKEITKLSIYENIVADLFTKQHYEQFRNDKYKSRSSSHHHRSHLNHYHF